MLTGLHLAHGGAEALSEEGGHALSHLGGEVPGSAAAGAGALLGPLSVAGGSIELIEGLHEGGAKGAVTATKGALGIVGGTGTTLAAGGAFAGTAGGSALAAAGPVSAAGIGGIIIGQKGDEGVKKTGMLHDDQGRPESASDRLGNRAWAVHEWAKKKGAPDWLAHTAAAGAGVAMLPAAGVTAVGGALANLGYWLGEELDDDKKRD